MLELKSKVALITGGASGQGREFSKELFKQGCKISICDINTEDGEELLHQLSKIAKERVIFCPCDVTDYPQFEEAFQTTVSRLGGVDIVINNASIMNDRLWELEVDVNLNGVIRGLLLAYRFMGKDRGGSGGVVVNIASSSCVRHMISLPIFTATKHAVIALTKSYGDSYHVNLTGVRVVGMCAPPFDTILNEDPRKRIISGEYEQAWLKDLSNITPVKSDYLARALAEIIQKVPSGTSWLVEGNNPPKEIKILP